VGGGSIGWHNLVHPEVTFLGAAKQVTPGAAAFAEGSRNLAPIIAATTCARWCWEDDCAAVLHDSAIATAAGTSSVPCSSSSRVVYSDAARCCSTRGDGLSFSKSLRSARPTAPPAPRADEVTPPRTAPRCDPARMAAAIIACVDQHPAPMGIVLGSQALKSTVDVLRARAHRRLSGSGRARRLH